MTPPEFIAWIIVGLGLFAGAFLFGRRPAFWIELGGRLLMALVPTLWRFVSRRMSPEEEAEWHRAERRGQGNEWLRQRWKRRRKQP